MIKVMLATKLNGAAERDHKHAWASLLDTPWHWFPKTMVALLAITKQWKWSLLVFENHITLSRWRSLVNRIEHRYEATTSPISLPQAWSMASHMGGLNPVYRYGYCTFWFWCLWRLQQMSNCGIIKDERQLDIATNNCFGEWFGEIFEWRSLITARGVN